jgi:fucose permease
VVCLAGAVRPGLTVFGGSFGSAEVAINVEGAAVEREMNKTVLPMMHGFYSLGTLAGAGVGMALTATGVLRESAYPAGGAGVHHSDPDRHPGHPGRHR